MSGTTLCLHTPSLSVVIRRAYILAVRLVIALGTVTCGASAITFSDGGIHVIDASNSFPSEQVIVQDSIGECRGIG